MFEDAANSFGFGDVARLFGFGGGPTPAPPPPPEAASATPGATGPVPAAEATATFGHYAEESPEAVAQRGRNRELYNRTNHDDGQRTSADMISAEYKSQAEIDAANAARNPDAAVGSLGTHDERMAAIDKLTQNDDVKNSGTTLCGPTSLVAAALYTQGGAGVKTLIDQMDLTALAKQGSKQQADMLRDLAKKSKDGGELNEDDMWLLKDGLYKHLRNEQMKDKALEKEVGKDNLEKPGINGFAMQKFLQNNKAMKDMFAQGNLHMKLIDNDNDERKQLNHFVLQMGNENAVYDPYARKSEHQVVSLPDEVADYTQTTQSAVN